MNKKEEDTWVICPECKTKLKKERLPAHMKRVHKRKMNDEEVENTEMFHKKGRENKTPKFISKRTIAIIILLFIVILSVINIYFLFYNQKDQKNHFISISIDGKGDYLSIQEAIDSASDNDILIVSNGIYFENINIIKSIELIGEDKKTTIIDGGGSGTIINILADNVKISGFTIKNGGSEYAPPDAGIKIESNNNTISDCMITSNNNYGLYLDANLENTIKFNTFSNNKYGIYAFNARTNTISSNTFTNNAEYGIYLTSESNDNLILENTFTENNYAIRIKESENTTILKNQIINNKYGLYFCCGALNNIVYNNNFKNNTVWNAEEDSINNAWDNGTVGNYWDDYTGLDANGDGIGDTPYLIKGGEKDRFPLMQPK